MVVRIQLGVLQRARKSAMAWVCQLNTKLLQVIPCIHRLTISIADSPDTHGIYYCLQKNSWCCPTGQINTGPTINTTCCNNTDLTFTAADPVVYTTANINFVSTMRASATPVSLQTQSSARTSGSSVSFNSQATATSASNSGTTSSNSSGPKKVAIGVGVPLGILLAIALGVIAWLVLKNKKLKQAATTHELPTNPAYVQPHYQHPQQEKPMEYPVQHPPQPYAQLANNYRPNELPPHEVAHEVPGSNYHH